MVGGPFRKGDKFDVEATCAEAPNKGSADKVVAFCWFLVGFWLGLSWFLV